MLKPDSTGRSGPSGPPATPSESSLVPTALDRALAASSICLGALTVDASGLLLLAATPSLIDLLALHRTPSESDPLPLSACLSPELAALWKEGCANAARTDGSIRFQYSDPRTKPPRRLEFDLTPMEGGGAAPRFSVSVRETAESFRQMADAGSAVGGGTDGAAEAGGAAPFRHLIDALPALIWTADAEGRRDYFNRSWTAFTGRRLYEDMGDGWTSHIHYEDLDRYRDTFQGALAGRNRFRIEYRMAAQDGTYHWMVDEGVPRFRSDGRFLGYVATCTDISDRKRVEKRLESSERWYRELIEGTNNLVLQLDTKGRIEFTNPMTRRILGSEPEECVGFPFLHFVHTEDREKTSRRLDLWWQGQETDIPFENRLVSRSGEICDLLWTAGLHLEGDRPVALSCIGQDITERKRSERIHKIQSQVLESMIEGVTLANQGGFVLYTNSALDKMFGYRPGELIGRHFSLLHGTPKGLSEQAFFDRLQEHGTYVGDFVHQRKDGSSFHTVARMQSIDIEGAAHWVSVIEDVDERRLAAEERDRLDARIRQAQKLESLGVLAGGIAHDFNNLLMVILGNASLVLQDLDEASPSYRDLEQIETAAVRASDLTKQMLAYSGRGQFLVEPIDLSEMIQEIDHLLESSVRKEAVLDLHLDGDLWKVEADVSQLRQVVISLVANASEALEENGGVILIRTGRTFCESEDFSDTFLADELPRGHYAFIEVADTGVGMDAATQSKIFDPFFTTKFTGRGLGLAAVLGIVRGHRGAIRVQSRLGEGTTLTILLPCIEPGEDPKQARDAASETSMDGTVLLVDDDADVRRMARRLLERLGLSVLEAESGEQALGLYAAEMGSISIVLLDMTMPRMDGEETFRRLKALDADVKVILSSGYSESVAERFEDRSLAGFLQKPYRQVELAQRLRPLLGDAS